MTNSRFNDLFEKEISKLSKTYDQFPWRNREAYAKWLAQTYYFVCHSTRLLALAASRFSFEEHRNHLRCVEHMREEKNHEILAIRDLRHLGYPHIRSFPESALTRGFYATQYFMIEHKHPSSLFGYILCLEGISAKKGPFAYSQVREEFGEKASQFWKVHATEDDGHLEAALTQISQASEIEMLSIEESFLLSCSTYNQILLEVQNAKELVQSLGTLPLQPAQKVFEKTGELSL